MFFSFVMVFCTILVWGLRLPIVTLPDAFDALAAHMRALAFGLCILWVPTLLDGRLSTTYKTRTISFHALRFLLAIGLLFLPLLAMELLSDSLAKKFIDFVIVSALALVVFFARRDSGKTENIGWSILSALILACAITASVYEKGYISPLASELSLAGAQHRDTLYHAAISGILHNTGVVSIGLDGLVPLSYHVLSHRLLGSFVAWSGSDYLSGHYLFFYIVGLPLLFALLLEAIASLRASGWFPLTPLNGTILFLCWPIVFSAFNFASYFSSESYLLSLIIMISAVPLIFAWTDTDNTVLSRLMLGLCLMLAVYLTASSKISTGAVFMSGVTFLVVANDKFRPAGFILAAIIALTPFLISFFSFGAASGENQIAISPFHYLANWQKDAVFHLILTIVTGVLVWKSLPENPRMKLVVFSFATMLVAAITSSMLLALPAGAEGYFANPGMWISLVLIGMLIPPMSIADAWPLRKQSAIAVLTLFAVTLVDTDRWRVGDRIESDFALIRNAAAEAAQDPSPSRSLVSSSILGLIKKQVLAAASTNKGNLLVFMSPEFHEFWAQNEICWAQSFVVPALTAQPMLKGLPPKGANCELTPYYGISSYDAEASSSEFLSIEQICKASLERGYSNVLFFKDAKGELISCQP